MLFLTLPPSYDCCPEDETFTLTGVGFLQMPNIKFYSTAMTVDGNDNYPPEFLVELQKRKFYKFGMNELVYGVTGLLEAKGYVVKSFLITHDPQPI